MSDPKVFDELEIGANQMSPSEEMKRAAQAEEMKRAAQAQVNAAIAKEQAQRKAQAQANAATVPAYPNFLTMFDNGTPEHFMITVLPYKKSLLNEITNLQQQRALINQRIDALQQTNNAIDQTIARIAQPYNNIGCEKSVY